MVTERRAHVRQMPPVSLGRWGHTMVAGRSVVRVPFPHALHLRLLTCPPDGAKGPRVGGSRRLPRDDAAQAARPHRASWAFGSREPRATHGAPQVACGPSRVLRALDYPPR